MSVLAVRDLAKSFGGVQALAGVSFEVAAGKMQAMIGPNGAGKTTCFNLLDGQLRLDAGRVYLAGTDITGLPTRRIWRLGVGRTFQIAGVFASMTVAENVQTVLLSHRRRLAAFWPRVADLYRDEALDLLAQVGMAEQAERSCGVLAYGDVKRVELAMALAHSPRLLLMDEPTAGMAPGERMALMSLVAGLARAREMAVLFTEHDMDAVFAHADRILVLDRGRLIADGSPAEVRTDARVRAVYLGSDAVAEAG
ncbi:MAG: ABC transporter ATP-binding protein [Rhodospirillales bacterium]|nr:ABC transporter ATP-binding protein [Rhodospirillales bacterium]